MPIRIIKKDFEAWLGGRCPCFKRHHSGDYLVPMSGRADARLKTWVLKNKNQQMRVEPDLLPLTVTFRVRDSQRKLWPSGVESLVGDRTPQWRDEWRGLIDEALDLYHKDYSGMEALAKERIEDYAPIWRAKIESVSRWNSFQILRDLHDQLTVGYFLTPRQEGAIEKFVQGKPQGNSQGQNPKHPVLPPHQIRGRQKKILDAVVQLGGGKVNKWTQGFCDSLETRLRQGRSLSPRQREVLRNRLTKAGIPTPPGL